jgi:NAD(P)-dependent dehydrogenase (short-subunit alcohol dehydrogenase family)
MSIGVAFITGAGSGMGRLYAGRLLEQGWQVTAVDVSEEALATIRDSEKLLKLVVDVRDFAAMEVAVQRTEQELGPITRVVNCAAIMPLGAVVDMDPQTVQRLFDINVGGLVNVTSATMPRMLSRGAGVFISFASLAGHVPIFYMGAYGATKSAVIAYTETMHQETRGRGVHVLCVCPPAVKTPLLQQGKDTRWPRSLDVLPMITADMVIDAVEKAIRKGRFWVFPGWYTRYSVIVRRVVPALLWWVVRAFERPTDVRVVLP